MAHPRRSLATPPQVLMADGHIDALALPRAPDLGQSEAWAFLRRLIRRRTALFGLVVVAAVVLAALLAPVLTPFDPLAQDIGQRLKPPGWVGSEGRAHWLGTDHLGRDILGRVLFGARIASSSALPRWPSRGRSDWSSAS